MRPRLYAIGHKVNSLPSEPSLSTCETWLLPQTCVRHGYYLRRVCYAIMNQEEDHRTARSIGQDGENTKREEQEEEPPKKLQQADVRTTPDDRPLTASGHPALGGRPAPEDQPTPAIDLPASGRPTCTGRPAILTEVRDFRTSGVPVTEHFQRTSGASGRPVPPKPPDIRPLVVSSFRLKPMYPFTSAPFCTTTINRPLPPPS